MRVLIRGAGDLASGVAQALWRAGMEILMTEIAKPLAVRRGAALAQAVYDGVARVEDMEGRLVENIEPVRRVIADGAIPVLLDANLRSLAEFSPQVLIDATLAKKNYGLSCGIAPFMLALGPGFIAGQDVDVVIETMRGNDLGRLIYKGEALPDSGIPGLVGGYSAERLLRANADGRFSQERNIGDMVEMGEIVAHCGEKPLVALIDGCLRGLLQQGLIVKAGMKVGDIDPHCEKEVCFTISDKARALGGAALVAIMQWTSGLLIKSSTVKYQERDRV